MHHDAPRPGVAVRMLTSGTTGPPKRIDLTYDMLARSVIGPVTDQRWCGSCVSFACTGLVGAMVRDNVYLEEITRVIEVVDAFEEAPDHELFLVGGDDYREFCIRKLR